MGNIQLRATFPSIANDNLESFKTLAQEAVVAVRGEAGAVQYDWFFNDDQTQCVVLEKYENSEAVLAHLGNTGAVIGRLGLGGGLEIEVFGELSPELQRALAGVNPATYVSFTGL